MYCSRPPTHLAKVQLGVTYMPTAIAMPLGIYAWYFGKRIVSSGNIAPSRAALRAKGRTCGAMEPPFTILAMSSQICSITTASSAVKQFL